MITKVLFIFCFIFFCNTTFSQVAKFESTKKDSTILVSTDSFSLKAANSDIKSKINYEAEDSIVYDLSNRKMYLYNKSKVNYEAIEIQSYWVDYDWPSGVMTARQKINDSGKAIGVPHMKQDDKEYDSEKLTYNFKSQQGKVYNVVTKEGEGFLHGHEVKKDSFKNWFVREAKYTTCDLENPHFHIGAQKLKLIPNNAIITGPANIVINNIPTPLYLPFGIFPLKKGRRSGIILPTNYGFSPVFNLQGLGYYFGINDYTDLTLSTSLYFNGSYGFNSTFKYNKNYKYTGSFGFLMHRTFLGDYDNPTVRANTPINFTLNWTHTQSPKANPTLRFNATMQYATQGAFNQSVVVMDNRRINSQINSSMSLTKTFRTFPLTLSSSVSYVQDLASKSINGQFPNLQANYIGNPFKSVGTKRWSDNINFQYNTQFNSQFSTYDSIFLSKKFFEDLKYGVLNTVTINFGGIKLLKYLNLTPSINYKDRFYFNRTIIQRNLQNVLDTQRQNGFYTVRDFFSSVNLSTVMVGMYQFSPNSKSIKGLRHQITPSASFSFAPNFAKDFWGYYNKYTDNNNNIVTYSPYQSNLWGVPGNSNAATLNFGINNSLEGKFYNKKDSINHSKKMSLVDLFSINGSYNFNADSNNLSNIAMTFVNSTSRYVSFNTTFIFDPYQYRNGVITKDYMFSKNKSLGRMTNISSTINFTLSNNNFGKKALQSNKGNEYEKQYIYLNQNLYYDFNSPWNLRMSLNSNIAHAFTSTYKDTTLVTASIMLNNFDFNLTKNWKLAITSGYNFNLKQVGLTTISAIRNMHCWEFRINYTPISNIGQAYSIEIRPKSPLLQDLKLSRNRPALENFF